MKEDRSVVVVGVFVEGGSWLVLVVVAVVVVVVVGGRGRGV